MGCVSSNLVNHNDEFPQLSASSALSHHIVSLTSTTYGFLNLDPPQSPTTPPTRFTFGSIFSSPLREPKPLWSEPEVINSWELMAGLDTESFRFSPLPLPPPPKPFSIKDSNFGKENSSPNQNVKSGSVEPFLDRFERICPPNGENRVVVYTTTLRGVRKTFEACNAVRAAMEGFGVQICERDVSMDRGFREELRELLKEKEEHGILPPRVFVKGSYVGGVEEVLRIVEEGLLGKLLEGVPRKKAGSVCEGCGDIRFLPCDKCNGSSKRVVVMMMKEEMGQKKKQGRMVVMRCTNCNENGLVICPICT